MKIASWNRKVMISILFICIVGCLLCVYLHQTVRNNSKVSYIYVTDLALNGDFDDFFDLAVMHKMDIDNLTIVLDNNDFAQDNIETSIAFAN